MFTAKQWAWAAAGACMWYVSAELWYAKRVKTSDCIAMTSHIKAVFPAEQCV